MSVIDARQFVGPFVKTRPRTEKEADAVHARYMVTNGGKQVRVRASVAVYVNHNRWVADCPACNSGMAVVPDWSQAWCFGCGSTVSTVCPSAVDRKLIVDELSARLSHSNRNWSHTETVSQLRAENIEHGIGLVR